MTPLVEHLVAEQLGMAIGWYWARDRAWLGWSVQTWGLSEKGLAGEVMGSFHV